jgi:hypothetical protein
MWTPTGFIASWPVEFVVEFASQIGDLVPKCESLMTFFGEG